jgi:hypothetical protein
MSARMDSSMPTKFAQYRKANPQYDSISDQSLFDSIYNEEYSHLPKHEVAKAVGYEDPTADGDFNRQFKNTFKQLPQTGYGLVAGAAATAESALGEGGYSSGLKNFAVDKLKTGEQALSETAKDSDSLTYSLDAAKHGDYGALMDWVQGSAGYAAGQGLQLLATGGVGGAAAKIGGNVALKGVVEGMVVKETARLAAERSAATMSAAELTKIATANVANKIGSMGSGAAVGAYSFGSEGGEIGGDLAKQSADRGTPLTGDEIATGLGSTAVAGGLESAGNLIGLDLLKGKSALLNGFESKTGILGKVARGGMAALGAAPIEAGTEYGQTLADQYGGGHDPFSDESLKQAFDAAGQGAVGGAVMAAGGGAMSSPKPTKTPEQKDQETTQAILNPDASIDDSIAAMSESLAWEQPRFKDIPGAEAIVRNRTIPGKGILSSINGQIQPSGYIPGEAGQVWEQPNTEQANTQHAKNIAFFQAEQDAIQRKADDYLAMEMNPDADSRQVKQYRAKRVELEVEKQLRAEAFRDGLGYTDIKYQSGQVESKPFASLNELIPKQDRPTEYDNTPTFRTKTGFGQLSEFSNFADELAQEKAASIDSLIERQGMRRESNLETLNNTLDYQQQSATQQNRLAILDNVLADDAVTNKEAKFAADIERAGFTDATITDVEQKRLAQYKELLSQQEAIDQDRIPSLPDEQDLYIKKKPNKGGILSNARQGQPDLSTADNRGATERDNSVTMPAGSGTAATQPTGVNNERQKSMGGIYSEQSSISGGPSEPDQAIARTTGQTGENAYANKSGDEWAATDVIPIADGRRSGRVDAGNITGAENNTSNAGQPSVDNSGSGEAALNEDATRQQQIIASDTGTQGSGKAQQRLPKALSEAKLSPDKQIPVEQGISNAVGQGKSAIDPILTKKRTAYLVAKKIAYNKANTNVSEGVKKSALKSIDDNYEADLNKASSALSFEQYKAMPVNKNQPEGILKQAHDALRQEYGITDKSTNEPAQPQDTAHAKALQAKAKSGVSKSPYQEKIDQARSEGKEEVELKWGDFEIRQTKIDGTPSFAVVNSKTSKVEGNFGSPETASIVAKRKSENTEATVPAANVTTGPAAKTDPDVNPVSPEIAAATLQAQGGVDKNLTSDIPSMTEEEYLSANGAGRQGIGDAATHRSSNKISPKTWSKTVEIQAKKDAKLVTMRDELRKEYQSKVASGEIREPSLTEQRIRIANGHPDNESTQAARRLLNKKGINWEIATSSDDGKQDQSTDPNNKISGQTTVTKASPDNYESQLNKEPVNKTPKNEHVEDDLLKKGENVGTSAQNEPATAYDAARAQELINDIDEGRMILRSGKTISGRKMSSGEISAVERAIKNSEEKLSSLNLGTVKFSKPQAATTNPHTEQSLLSAIRTALDGKFYDGWTEAVMDTGKFKIISMEQAKALIGGQVKFHKVWHGSPHDHDGFDSGKIGTGEGAQAFGYGHYFSDEKSIAEYYRATTSSQSMKIDGKLFSPKTYIINEIVGRNATDLDNLKDRLNEYAKENKGNPYAHIDDAEKIVTAINNGEFTVDNGILYEVELAPAKDEYLDWDRPLSKQSRTVKTAFIDEMIYSDYLDALLRHDPILQRLKKLAYSDASFSITEQSKRRLEKEINNLEKETTIRDLYNNLTNITGSDINTSELLRSVGIRGIRYKANSGKSDANNYVIFDDTDIKIEAKYSKNGYIVAFYDPATDTSHFVFDNISQDASAKELLGLVQHEVSVHALRLGLSDAEFSKLLEQFERMAKFNPKIKAAFDRVPKDTNPEHVTEEALAYFLESSPTHSFPKKIISAFRKALRSLARLMPPKMRGKWAKWAFELSEGDIISMATEALREAPSSLQFDSAGRENESVRLAQEKGYRGNDKGESEEWLRSVDKGLDMSKRARLQRGREMGFMPKSWYHLTPNDFTEFDTTKSDMGAHFGTYDQAMHRQIVFNHENYIMIEAKLSVRNPLRLKDTGTFHADGIAKQLERKGLLDKGEGVRIEKEIDADWKLRKKYDPYLKQVMKDAGYDGIIYKNEHEGAGDSIIVFDSNKIRSVDAAFDPDYKDSGNLLASKTNSSESSKKLAPIQNTSEDDHASFYENISRNFIKDLNNEGENIKISGDYVTLYHGTSKAAANKILKSGVLKGHSFFAYNRATATRFGYAAISSGKPEILEVKVKLSDIAPTGGYFTSRFDNLTVDANGIWGRNKSINTKNNDIRYSKISDVTAKAKDFVSGNDRNVNSLSDIDKILATGKMPKDSIDMQSVLDKAATMFVDSSRPFDAWTRKLNNSIRAGELIFAKDRAKRRTAIFEKQAMDDFLHPLAKVIDNISKNHDLDYRAAKELAGQWMTARYAIEKNNDYIRQDQQAVDDAQAALDEKLEQDKKDIAQGKIDSQPANGDLKSVLTKAQNKQQERLSAIHEKRRIDPAEEVLGAGLSGGYNNFTAKLYMDAIEVKIPLSELEKSANHVYDMLAWKLDKDLENGKVTQAMVDTWQNSRYYVPLTGDPSVDESDDPLFSHGSLNQQSDKKAEGRKGSIAQNGIDAATEQVQKSARYHGWLDFKDKFTEIYDELIQVEKDDGLNQQEAQRAVSEKYGIDRQPETGLTRPSDSGLIIRKGGKGWVYDINDATAMDALRSVNKEDVPSILQPIAFFTRSYARMVTQPLPGFAAINAIRDTWEKSENIRTRALPGYESLDMDKVAKEAIRTAANPKLIKKLMGVMFEGTRLESKFSVDESDPDIQMIREMIKEGGTSTVGDYLNATSATLAKQMKDSLKLSTEAMNVVSAWNNSFELVSSYSIYKALRNAGVDQKIAASGTLNLMNFGKQGTVIGPLKALYVFTNPTMQGGHQMLMTLGTKKGKARAAAYLIAGTVLYTMLRAGDDDDETGINRTDQLGNFVLERNIPIKIPGTNEYIKIPIGFGMPQAMWSTAVNVSKFMFGDQSAVDSGAEILKSFSRTLAPVQPSETSISKHPLVWMTQTFSPQVIKPMVNIALDVNTFGSPLTNSRFQKPDVSNALQGRKSTPEEYKAIAQELAKFGIDLYPEQVREIIKGYAVGPMNEITKAIIENPYKESLGRDTISPMFDRYIATQDASALKERLYYRYRDEMNEAAVKESVGEVLSPREEQLAKLVVTVKKLENKANGKMAAATKQEKGKNDKFKSPYRKQSESIRESAMKIVFNKMKVLSD